MRLRTHTRVWQTAGGAAWLLAFGMGLAGCEKWRLDAEVDALCAKDGGLKVYETVALPAEQFDQWGMVKFYRPTAGEDSLGPDYKFEHDLTTLKPGNPRMIRDHYRIKRRLDGVLLGEAILYGRGGGDLIGPWQDSSYSCPANAVAGPNALIRVVLKSQAEGRVP